MEPFTVLFALTIIVLCASGLGMIAHLWLNYPYERIRPSDPEEAVMSYCMYCGCRHHAEWMMWQDDGSHRCIICCQAEVTR